mmetsp:Transcript_3808/g.6918  ORF Transcript_3808/g.6918 Transcript_3808/m.6918 type:complete len:312 (+) Transcript_3808:381-1316(+)
MTLHDSLPLGDLGDGGSMLLNLLVLEEVGSKGGTDEDVNLVLRLEPRSHLLVDNFLRNGGGGGVRIFSKEFLGGLHGKRHGIRIIDVLGRTVVLIITTPVILFLSSDGIFKIRFFFLRLFILFLVLFLLLLILGFLLLFLLLFLILTAIAVFLHLLLVLVLLLTSLLGIGFCLLVLSKNVRAELMGHIHHIFVTTGSTLVPNNSRFDFVLRLRQTALGAKHESLNVLVHQILQRLVGMMTIYNRLVRLGIVTGLRPQLTSKELVHFPRITVQTESHISNVGNDSFATITTSFLFTKDSGHFIAVFGIIDRR